MKSCLPLACVVLLLAALSSSACGGGDSDGSSADTGPMDAEAVDGGSDGDSGSADVAPGDADVAPDVAPGDADDGPDLADVAPDDADVALDDGDAAPGDAAPGDADSAPDDADAAGPGDADAMPDDADVVVAPSLEKKVLAFYYPWYRTPAFSGSWWHWDENGHNPNQFVSPGRRDIAAKNYPALDVYDSLDPDVVDLHIQQSVEAGIDAWIISWWGDDKEISLILERIQALESPLKVAAYYERMSGCSEEFCPKLTPEEKVAAGAGDIVELLESMSDDPAWLTVDGEPVVFVYIRAMSHGMEHWDAIIEEIESTHPVFISGDISLTNLWQFFSTAFDQLHVYNPTGQIDYMGEETLQYELFCERTRDRGQSCATTVIPGHDNSAVKDEPIIIDREGGELYQRLWEESVAADADWVLITSFNEWHEGTEIEPSLEFGEAYLDATATQAETFRASGD